MRSVWGELSYWHVLAAGAVAPPRGWPLAWYWIIGMPQAFFPFLVAERFYAGTAARSSVTSSALAPGSVRIVTGAWPIIGTSAPTLTPRGTASRSAWSLRAPSG
jgi:hypothetical protein